MVPEEARTRAIRRVRELRDFYSHLAAYILVCTVLVIVDLATGDAGTTFIGLNWAYWPILGWGVFVAIHAIGTFSGFTEWEERKVEELYEREKQKDLLHR